MNVDGLIAHHGYYALFALVALESLGIPLPGETILMDGRISDRVFRVTVRRILDVRWQRDGSLAVEVLGVREVVTAA